MNTGLQMHDIHKRFASTDIVRGLCLEVKSGEILALLGPSGCGKTTALRMVAGLERPDSGRITIGEHTVFDRGVDRPPETRRIGMVFQSYAVWPHMRIIENVAYPLRLTKAADATDRALRALRLVRLDGMAQRTPDTLSGGQQQRVALARALVAEPDLLLFDEPLSNLDAKLREEMRHEIRQLIRTAGCTAVYVTHDQLEAFAVSDRVAVMLDGVLAQVDAPRALYTNSCSLAVARFVGRLSELRPLERTGERHATLNGKTLPIVAAQEGEGPWVLGVRPEDARMVAPDAGLLRGTVDRVTYLGERTEVAVRTDVGVIRVDATTDIPDEGSNIGVQWTVARAYLDH